MKDEIGNDVAVIVSPSHRVSRQGFLYTHSGALFMYISGGFSEAEIALSVHSWEAAGFINTEGTVVTADNSTEYRVDVSKSPARLVAREPLPATLDGYVLKGVPDGGKVTIEGIEYPTDGTDITLQFGRPGTYVVKCEGFPYTPVEVEVVYGN